jgi:hypothetical protein
VYAAPRALFLIQLLIQLGFETLGESYRYLEKKTLLIN